MRSPMARRADVLKLGALESTTASRLPAVFCAFHQRFPDVRIELTTGTNDALVAAVADRRLDAAFVAVAPSRPELSHCGCLQGETGADHVAGAPARQEGRGRRRRLGDCISTRVRVQEGSRALARGQGPGFGASPRAQLLPRDRGVRRLGRRGRDRAAVGTGDGAVWSGSRYTCQGIERRVDPTYLALRRNHSSG